MQSVELIMFLRLGTRYRLPASAAVSAHDALVRICWGNYVQRLGSAVLSEERNTLLFSVEGSYEQSQNLQIAM